MTSVVAALPRLKVRQVRPVSLPCVHHVEAGHPGFSKNAPDRLDGRAQGRQIAAEPVHVSGLAAEVDLHVDDHERGVVKTQLAASRKGMRSRADARPHGRRLP